MKFPEGFYWGAATAAYQVEGGIENCDWAKAAREGRVPPAGRACDHYNRYEEDFDLAKELSHNAHRFSVEWARIEPEEGKFDEQAIEHYREVVRALRDRGIEPFITLWHWTLPVWFEEKGGWLHADAVDNFLRFVEHVVCELDEVKYWVVYNEPETFARHGYYIGNRPPFVKNPFKAYKVLRKLITVYVETYKKIKSVRPDAEVGFSESLVYFEAYNNAFYNKLLLRLIKWWRNNPFFDTFVKHADFIGLQYYFHTCVRLHWKSNWGIQFNENKTQTDMGWEIYPEGIYHALKELQPYGKPVYVTENGLADADDKYRAAFISEHLAWCYKAIEDGVDLRGYFHWSLIDNYEWHEGYWPRFGLIEIDYDTLERKVRPSAYVYKEIIERGGVVE